MRRAIHSLAVAGFLLAGWASRDAFAQEATDNDARHNTEEPKEAEKPVPVLTPTPAPAVVEPAGPAGATPKPKFGDLTTSGYFRGGFGGSNQKGRMTCFSLPNPQGLVSKYRLGNECEVWGEYHLTSVVYVGDDGSVARLHFMPVAYIPNTFIGYTPTGVTSSDNGSPATGATVAFPNLYADITGISWLPGATAWVGTRYYKREFIYISDFFYWNPSGVGGGIEDFALGKVWPSAPAALRDLTISYGLFAVDGQPVGSPQLPLQFGLGFRNDLQVRGLKPWQSGELQLGFQYIANWSATAGTDAAGNPITDSMGNPITPTHGGWGVTGQFVQKLLGGDLKLAAQYGKGGGTGFGTLARFYYPDFSLNHDPAEWRFRAIGVMTIQPTEWLGAQLAGVFQHDNLGGSVPKSDWYSAGGRVSLGFTQHAKLLGEAGGDYADRNNGSVPQWLAKFTGAVAITTERGFYARPELRLFYTWARWNETARMGSVDSYKLYTNTNLLTGSIFGLQAETWW